MGKPTGFMDYKRQELALRPPQERIKDWEEIKTSSLPHKEELQKQAARCMDCSIPFCHSGVMLGKALSGCPLHNLMPEFNDFVYQGLDHFAYARLNKTNNFPEFTSHVCPAPCEGACSASLAGSAVSIRNLEQYIIETAFAEPEKFFTEEDFLKIKSIAFKNGYALMSYTNILGVLIRDKYFEQKGINVEDVDKHDPHNVNV
jgi:glutamate synthase (NADPH/NADH) small chain